MIRLSKPEHVPCPKCSSILVDFIGIDRYETGTNVSLTFRCTKCDTTLLLEYVESGAAVETVWTDITTEAR